MKIERIKAIGSRIKSKDVKTIEMTILEIVRERDHTLSNEEVAMILSKRINRVVTSRMVKRIIGEIVIDTIDKMMT